MNTKIIQNIIVNEIIPNNNKYLKNNIICSLKRNKIIIEYKKNTYSLKSKKNYLILSNKNKIINKFNNDTPFKKIIEHIKNIH